VHELPDSSGDLLFATIADGYTELVGGVERHLGTPGQLGLRSVYQIENTTAGTLYIAGDDEPPVMLKRGGWEPVAVAPPYARHPDEPALIPPATTWSETKVLVDPAGTIYTVSAGAISPGTRATGTWRGGRPVALGVEQSNLVTQAALVTPDGQLWTVWYGEVYRFTGGKWVLAGTYDAKPPGGLDVSFDVQVLTTSGPPWVLHDRQQKRLMLFSHDPAREHPNLVPLPVTEGGASLPIEAAIPWRSGAVLLATDRGLRLYDVAKRTIAPAPVPSFSAPVKAFCRDRRGRLWIAGDGLWLVDARGQTLQALDGLPTGHSQVVAIAPDPAHDDGVIASLSERGILFVHGGP
jgi:hypothetical protein